MQQERGKHSTWDVRLALTLELQVFLGHENRKVSILACSRTDKIFGSTFVQTPANDKLLPVHLRSEDANTGEPPLIFCISVMRFHTSHRDDVRV